MKSIFLILLVVLIGVAAITPNHSHTFKRMGTQETVILLHGLCRTSRSMKRMEASLTANGYHVINVDYPSRSAAIGPLSDQVFTILQPELASASTVHFVTHSMGGILLREHLEDHTIPNLGRVVMLAPPSRGSEVTDKLSGFKLYQWINGPAGNQLGTGTASQPLRLKAPDFELGIVAGDRSINPILSMLIPGPDDGKVALARVKPAAYSDALLLHVTHACMMKNPQVIQQTLTFLQTGAFNKGETP